MDSRGQRPPRSARPPQSPAPPYHSQASVNSRSPGPEYRYDNARGISFQNNERGDRQAPVDQQRDRSYSAYQPQSPTPSDPAYAEAGGYIDGRVGRKKSLVKPDREKIDPGHRQYHYHNHVAQMQDGSNIDYMPSCTWPTILIISGLIYLVAESQLREISHNEVAYGGVNRCSEEKKINMNLDSHYLSVVIPYVAKRPHHP